MRSSTSSCVRCAVAGWAAAALLTSAARSADDVPAVDASHIQLLVEQLGAPLFERREQAGRELKSIGLPALAPLRRASSDQNLEIAGRARRILVEVERLDHERRMRTFLQNPAAAPDDLLPGLRRFRASVGADSSVAPLFVSLQRAEPELCHAAESQQNFETVYATRCSELFVEYNFLQNRSRVVDRTVALLFWGAEAELKEDPQIEQFVSQFVHWAEFRTAMATTPGMKKVLGMWVRKGTPATAYQKILIGLNQDVPECLEPAVATCKGGAALGVVQYAIFAVARFGNEEHVPLLEKFLRDETTLSRTQQNNRTTWESRLQDVALVALLELTKQDPKTYHFKRLERNPQFVYAPNTIGFSSAADRSAALAKWNEWRAAPPAEAELPATAAPRS